MSDPMTEVCLNEVINKVRDRPKCENNEKDAPEIEVSLNEVVIDVIELSDLDLVGRIRGDGDPSGQMEDVVGDPTI